jgi:transposase
MTQIHKRFATEQVKALLEQYCQGTMTRAEVEDILDISKSRFFILLAAYRRDPAQFSVSYERASPQRLSSAVESALERELRREKGLVEDRRLPISDYNYSAVRDRLTKEGLAVSLSTVIDRAKRLDCYKPPHKTKAHDREVITAAIGALVQHDASIHLWSPFASEKWTLITSIDDFSRKLLFADFFTSESTWLIFRPRST